VSNALAIIEQDVWSVQEQFTRMAGDSLSFEREAGFAIQVITASEYAMRIATENRQSVMNAVVNVAGIGISLNPAKRQAYLVPRDGKICLDISYMGLLDLAIQSGSIMWGQAELVHEADKFELNGFDKPPTHGRNPFAKDRGAITGVYAVVKTRDGDYLTTCMSLDEVTDIRDRSSAWKAWISKQKKCPWVTDEGEMIKKTVIKRAYKLWPKTDRLDKAVHFLNNEGGEGLAELASNDEPAKSTGGSSARDVMREALMAMSAEAQMYMRELADEVGAIFENPEAGADPAFDRIEIDQLDNDQRMALWYLLPSNVRSALKAVGERRRKGHPAPAKEAA
jgi:recombination protein RecT